MVNIGINGFGRIGRAILRSSLTHSRKEDINIVAINDPFIETEYIAYLLKYDSVHGQAPATVIEARDKDSLSIDGKVIKIFHNSEPSSVPWGSVGVDIVIEASGVFTTSERAGTHLAGGATKVIITAASSDAPCFAFGVNEDKYKRDIQVFSASSCTSLCAAPLLKLLNESFNIQDVSLTTIHAVSSANKTVDAVAKNWRMGRSVLNAVIPGPTTASTVLPKILPFLQNKVVAQAYYVPTTDVCTVDLTIRVEKITTKSELDAVIHNASISDRWKRIIGETSDPVVSCDFVGDERSCVYDVKASQVMNGNVLKVVCWYDNEVAYAARTLDMVLCATTTAAK